MGSVVRADGAAGGPRIVETDAHWLSSQPQQHVPARPTHRDSSQISQFLNPVNGAREYQRRRGIAPVDHARNNRNAVREASSRNQMMKKSKALEEEEALAARRKRAPKAPHSRVPLSPVRQDGEAGGGGERDFVRENLSAASSQRRFREMQERKPKSKEEAEDEDGKRMLSKLDYGRVPAYLQERQMEMMTDRVRALAAKEKKAPRGMRQLDEEERLASLAMLERNKKEVETLIFKLPFNCETVGQKRRKNELEMRLKEVEDGIKLFSRRIVYVKLDE